MHGPTLTLSIASSRRLRLAGLALHTLAVAALLLADLAAWVRVILLLVVSASLLLQRRRQAAHEIRCEPDGSLQIRGAGEWQAATLLPASVVTPWLVVLHYRVEDMSRTHHLVILPDSLPSDDFRRLRVWLKWKAKPAGDATPIQPLAKMARRLYDNLPARQR